MCIFCDTKRIMVAHTDGTGPFHFITLLIDLNLSRKRAKIAKFGHFLTHGPNPLFDYFEVFLSLLEGKFSQKSCIFFVRISPRTDS